MNTATTTATAILDGIENLSADNLNTYLLNTGLFVSPHIGRSRIAIAIPKEWLQGDKDCEFRKNNMKAGTIQFLPAADEAKLASLENAVRRKVKTLSVGMEGKFMPMTVYKDEFLPFFQDTKAEYFALRDKLVQNWDKLVDEFKASMHEYLVTLPTYSPELEKGLMASIPTAETFRRSFYMELERNPFPLMKDIGILDPIIADEVRDSARDAAINMVHEVMATILNDVNEVLSEKIISHCSGKAFDGHTTNTINGLISRVTKNNILQHPVVETILHGLNQVASLLDARRNTLRVSTLADIDENIVENMEAVMINSFRFAKEVGIELKEAEALPSSLLAMLNPA